MQMIVAAILGLLAAFGASTTAAAQDGAPIALPGAVWAIVPPPGFTVIANPIAAFRHPSGALILVQDSPKQPVTKADFDPAPGHEDEMRIDELTEVTAGGNHGFLLVAYMNARQAKSVTLTVEGKETNGTIISLIPDHALSQVSVEMMKTAVLSAVEQPKSMEDRLVDLPFRLGDTQGMRVADYVFGSFVSLTDGPLDDPEAATDQSFAMLLTMDTGGAVFDPTGELGPMVQRLKQEYPDASILSSSIIETPDGKIAEIRYERTTQTSHLMVGGVTWAKQLGDSLAVIMISQHPRGDEAAFAKLRRVRDGLRAR